jgi:F0F1-type ATP synthase delta subunit
MFIFSLILLEVIIFFVLIFIFRRIMTDNVVLATRHLEKLSQDFGDKEKELARQQEEVRQQSQELLTKTQEETSRIKAETVKEAQAEKDNILKQARQQSEEMIQQADRSGQLLLREINERIEKESVNKACELIHDTLPEQFKQGVHMLWVEELLGDGFNQLDNLRIPEGIREIKITSAFSLNEEQRKTLFKKLKSVVGPDVILKEEIDPRVVAGLIINIGSLVLDGSLKNKIQEKAKNV